MSDVSYLLQLSLESLAYILGRRASENSYRTSVDRSKRVVVAKEVCVAAGLGGPSFNAAIVAVDALVEVPRILMAQGRASRVASVDDLPRRLGMVMHATYGAARVSICSDSSADGGYRWVFEVAYEHEAGGGPREVR